MKFTFREIHRAGLNFIISGRLFFLRFTVPVPVPVPVIAIVSVGVPVVTAGITVSGRTADRRWSVSVLRINDIGVDDILAETDVLHSRVTKEG